MKRYRFGIWPNHAIWNNYESDWMKRHQDIMNAAFGSLGEQAPKMDVNEVATITLKKEGRIYKVKIQDITDLQEEKDEIISIEIDSSKDDAQADKKNDSADANDYYTE